MCAHHESTCCVCGGVLCLLWWVILSKALCLFLSRRDFSFLRRFFRSWMMEKVREREDKRKESWGMREMGSPCSLDTSGLRQLLPLASH